MGRAPTQIQINGDIDVMDASTRKHKPFTRNGLILRIETRKKAIPVFMPLRMQPAFLLVPAHSKRGQWLRLPDRGCVNAFSASSWPRDLKQGAPLAPPLLPQTRVALERRTTSRRAPRCSRCSMCFHGVPGSYRLCRGYTMIRVP